MPTYITKVCEICGQSFNVVLMKKKQKTCLAPDCLFKSKSAISSERMKRRRNGGDPALNAKLSKACSEHFKRLWKNPDFRAARAEESRVHILKYMEDKVALAKRDARSSAIFKRARVRLEKETEFLDMLADKVRQLMLEDPWMARDDRYYADYFSQIVTKANTDPELRAYVDAKMSVIFTEEYARARKSKKPPPT